MPIPSSMSPGTYYLGAFVDDQEQISESSDSNNTRVADSGTITLTQSVNTLSVSVSGFGSVVSRPAGINCPSSCSANFAANSNVSLSATPASGWSFAGWGGACSGLGNPCSVTIGNLPPGASESVWKYFYFDIPVGPTSLAVTLDNLSEDADLYVRFNAKPDLSNYDCRPYLGGTSTEVCSQPGATGGRWWVGVINFASQTSIAFRVTAAWGNSSSGDFFTLVPCRVLDTRNGSNVPLTGGTTYEVTIAELCGVPATAKSVSANITVVNATAGGYLVFYDRCRLRAWRLNLRGAAIGLRGLRGESARSRP